MSHAQSAMQQMNHTVKHVEIAVTYWRWEKLSNEPDKKRFCIVCDKDQIMIVHHSNGNPTTYTCPECEQEYADCDGELLPMPEVPDY